LFILRKAIAVIGGLLMGALSGVIIGLLIGAIIGGNFMTSFRFNGVLFQQLKLKTITFS